MLDLKNLRNFRKLFQQLKTLLYKHRYYTSMLDAYWVNKAFKEKKADQVLQLCRSVRQNPRRQKRIVHFFFSKPVASRSHILIAHQLMKYLSTNEVKRYRDFVWHAFQEIEVQRREDGFEDLLSIFQLHNNSKVPLNKKFKERLLENHSEISDFSKIAEDNYLKFVNNRDDYTVMNQTITVKINQVPRDKVIFLPLPFHFYTASSKNERINVTIRRFWIRMILELKKQEAFLLPFVQANIDFPRLFKNLKTITYHTKGSSPFQIHIKESPIYNLFHVDTGGYSGWLSINSQFQSLGQILQIYKNIHPEDSYQKLYQILYRRKETKYSQQGIGKAATSKQSLPEKFIFLPTQIIEDRVAELANITIDELIMELSKIAKLRKLNLVIKRHPKCNSPRIAKILRKVAESPYVTTTNRPTDEIISRCMCVITVNSGVGLEALIALKNVITTGQSDYELATHKVASKQELQAAIDNLEEIKIHPEDIKSFLAFYYDNYLYSSNNPQKIIDTINQNFRSSTH